MWLVSLQMRGSVARIFGDGVVQIGIFWTIRDQSYIVYYPIISYQRIHVYRVETMDMGRSH